MAKKIFSSFKKDMITFADKTHNPVFGVNPNSAKLKFCRDDFFIRIKGYGKNDEWVKCVKETAEESVNRIRNYESFEEVLKYITKGIQKANKIPLDIPKRFNTGILRTDRAGWECSDDYYAIHSLITAYGQRGHFRYKTYESKLDDVIKHPLKNPFRNLELTRPIKIKKEKFIKHSNGECINNAFAQIEKIYNFILENYVKKEVKQTDLNTVNNSIGEIRWILAHATPWERGSDAISNVFMKALYKAIGIKTSKPAKGISFDLEAFCTNLDNYKRNFVSLFENPPEIVE